MLLGNYGGEPSWLARVAAKSMGFSTYEILPLADGSGNTVESRNFV